MKSHKAKIICFQLTVLISFIFFTQAVSAEKAEKHVIDFIDVILLEDKDRQANKTNITIINPEYFTKDPNDIKEELFALKGIGLTPDTKVFFYDVDHGILVDWPEAIDENDKIYFIFRETVRFGDQPPRYEVLVKVKNLKPLPEEIVRIWGMPPIKIGIVAWAEKALPEKLTYVTLMSVEESLEGRGKYYAIFEFFALKKSESDKEDKKESLIEFTFPIHEIYHFNIRLGFIYSTLKNPEYDVKTIFTPDSSQKQRFLVITSKGDTQFDPVLSVVIYPNGSDLRLNPNRKKLLERIHPVIGFPLHRVFQSLFVGINYEFSTGADIIAGVRFGKVKKLNSDIVPYEPGKGGTLFSEDVTLDNIPFKERWESSFSLAITFDTAVLTRLFRFD